MLRLVVRLFLAALVACGLGLAVLAQAPAPDLSRYSPDTGKRVLILFGADADWPEKPLHAVFAANLVGRFGRATVRDLKSYDSGDLDGFDAAIVLGSPDTAAPAAAVRDLLRTSKPVLWAGPGAQALFADPASAALGWTPGPATEAAPRQVAYKGETFTREAEAGLLLAPPVVTDPSRARVLAQTRDGDRTLPWAVRSGRFFYIPESPLAMVTEDDRYLVLADLMFDLLAPATPERHRAMVRIEDVGPDADPARLRRIADLLHAQGVPFSVTVYDTYRDPDGHNTHGVPVQFTLRKRGGVVDALKYMSERGGTLVMHGHTHQTDERPNPYAKVSGGDYEFYAAALDGEGAFALKGPLATDTTRFWGERIDRAFATWEDVGLSRPAFHTVPHYAASRNAYAALRARFPARYERVLYFADEAGRFGGRGSGDQFFPYEVRDLRGDLIVPENLGYYSGETAKTYFGRDENRIVRAAERNLVVRDGFASFFHHWFESEEALMASVSGIKKLGYRFVSPAEVARSTPSHFRAEAAGRTPLPVATKLWIHAYRLAEKDYFIGFITLAGLLGLLAEIFLTPLTARRRAAA
ncbi:MAG TPA: DUF2334 domain-containing protein [Caulobacteraceae bacterium]|nr:DUF2334 domain-containing protein [Caulobacteraceae bacterium]